MDGDGAGRGGGGRSAEAAAEEEVLSGGCGITLLLLPMNSGNNEAIAECIFGSNLSLV